MTTTGSISIILGPITNPPDDTSSETFTLISYTADNFLYTIDEIDGGLIPSFGCTTPCETCAKTVPTRCLTCFTEFESILEKYWYDYTCLEECPDGYYPDDEYIC